MTVISADKFKDDVRQVVLNALDKFTRELLGHPDARGWVDKELPSLFTGVDAHAKALAARINAGVDAGSINVTIADESSKPTPVLDSIVAEFSFK